MAATGLSLGTSVPLLRPAKRRVVPLDASSPAPTFPAPLPSPALASHTARRILDTLQTMASPLMNASRLTELPLPAASPLRIKRQRSAGRLEGIGGGGAGVSPVRGVADTSPAARRRHGMVPPQPAPAAAAALDLFAASKRARGTAGRQVRPSNGSLEGEYRDTAEVVGRSDRGGQPPAKRPAQGPQEGPDEAAGAHTMAGNGGATMAAPAAVPIKTPFPRAPQGTARNGAADGVAVTKATDPSAFSFGLQAAKAQLASRPTTMAPTEHRASEGAGRPKVSLKALSSYKAARASAEEDAKGRTQKVRLAPLLGCV